MAVAVAKSSGGLSSTNINRANSGIADIIGVEFLSTKQIAADSSSALTSASPSEKRLSALNALISRIASVDAFGCGVGRDYGQILNCTIAKLGEQFQLQGVSALSSGAKNGSKGTLAIRNLAETSTANSTPMVVLSDSGYQVLLSNLKGLLSSGLSELKDVASDLSQTGVAIAVNAATFEKYVSNGISAAVSGSDKIWDDYKSQLRSKNWKKLAAASHKYYQFAQLSELVYQPSWASDSTPTIDFTTLKDSLNERLLGDWRPIDWTKFDTELRPSSISGGLSDLQFNVFINSASSAIVFVYRGTSSIGDLVTDSILLLCNIPGVIPRQYGDAWDHFAKLSPRLAEVYGSGIPIYTTGHSLGGGIASFIASKRRDVQAIVFNSAPLCSLPAILSGTDPLSYTNIKQFVVNGEIVTSSVLIGYRPGADFNYFPNPVSGVVSKPIAGHKIGQVLFAMDVARSLCSEVPNGCSELELEPAQSPSTNETITVNNLPLNLSTDRSSYQPELRFTGTGFNSINRVIWTCAEENGNQCAGSPLEWTSSDWSRRFKIVSDFEAIASPLLVDLNLAFGKYKWTAKFSGTNVASTSISFDVNYFNNSSAGFIVEDVASSLFTPGTNKITVTSSPQILPLSITGKSLDSIQSIEWRWTGSAAGSASWQKGDANWLTKVKILPDGKLLLSPTVVESNATWVGSSVWSGSLTDSSGRSQNITFSVSRSGTGTTPTCSAQQVFQNGVCTATSPSSPQLSSSTPVWDSASPAGPAVRLNWGSGNGTTSYDVYRNGVKIYPSSGTFTGNTFYNSTGLTPGLTYSYYVVATNSAGSTQSNSISVGPMPSAPAALPGTFALTNLTPVWDSASPAGPAVRLNWGSSNGTTSYDVYRNGVKIYPSSGTFTGNTFYNSTGLTPGLTYSYYVVATNSAGSTQSNSISVGPMPSAPAALPGTFALTNLTPVWDSASPAGPAVRLNWGSSNGTTSYDVYRNGVKIYPSSGTFTGNTFYNSTGLTPGLTYSYYVVATNSAGSTQSNSISVGPMPSAPAALPGTFALTNLTPVWDSASPAGPAVRLNWGSSNGTTSYDVYRNGVKIYPSSGTFTGNTFYNSTGLTPGLTYSYYVVATNSAGSTQSNSISVGPMPSAPAALPGTFALTNLTPVWDSASPAGPAVRLNWGSSNGTTSYDVYRNGVKIYPSSGTFTGNTFYNSTGLTPGLTYSYYVVATNSAGSTQSNSISVGPMPSAPAALPGTFALTNLTPVWDSASPAGPAVRLNWGSSNGTTSYDVYRNGVKIYPSSGTFTGNTFYNSTGLTPGLTYSYYVVATNSAGSTQSNSISVGPMPSAPAALPGTFALTNLTPVWDSASPAGPAVRLNWGSSNGTTSYDVYRNGVKIYPSSGTFTGNTFYNSTGLTPGLTYSYYVVATNSAGSTQSNSISVGPMPSAPAALPGTFALTNLTPVWDSASPAGPAVRLNWGSSNGTTSYDVYRNGVKIYPSSGTFTGNTFYNSTGLTPGLTYSYYVVATNSAGSTQSNSISVGPMPSAPAALPGTFALTNLTPVWDSASPAGPAVRLNWGSSNGTTSYDVYRNGVKIYPSSGTFTGNTFYNSTGLTPGLTYSYYVVATNSAGSTQSNSISVGPMPSAPAALPGTFALTNLTPVWDSASPAGPAVRLNWGSSNGTTSYDVYRNGVKIYPSSGTFTGNTFYNSTGLTPGLTYSYYVVATNSAGSTQSNSISVGPMPSAPAALPGTFALTNLTPVWDSASPAGPAVRLNWGSSNGTTSYDVYRNGVKIYPSSGTFTGNTFYNSTGLTPGLTYSYYVVATNSAGSTQSNSISVGPMPSN